MAKQTSKEAALPKDQEQALETAMAKEGAADVSGTRSATAGQAYTPKGDPAKVDGVGGAKVERVTPRNQQANGDTEKKPGKRIAPTVAGSTPPQAAQKTTEPTVKGAPPPDTPEPPPEDSRQIRSQIAEKKETEILDAVRDEVETSLLEVLGMVREYESEDLTKWAAWIADDVTTLGLIKLRLAGAADDEKQRLAKLYEITAESLQARRAALTRLPEFFAQVGLRRGTAAVIDLAERLAGTMLRMLLAA